MTAQACAHCLQPTPAELALTVKNVDELVIVWYSPCERRSRSASRR